jgi:hypothetical protein
MLRNVTSVATFTDNILVLVNTNCAMQGSVIFIYQTFTTYSDSREQYARNLSVIYGLTEIWDHLEGTFLYLRHIKSTGNMWTLTNSP